MVILDKAKQFLGMAIDPVKQMIADKKESDAEQAKLQKWKKRLSQAMSEHDKFRDDCAKWDALYHGTKAVGPNVGRTPSYMSERYGDDYASNAADARQVVNICFQLVESQIDITVPMPSVHAIEGDDNNERKAMIEGYLTYLAEGPELERINSENERIAKKNGICVYKIDFDPGYKSHKFRGRIRTTNPHPVNVIPQPGVYRVKDMDYIFHIENRTLDKVCEMYGEEYREELESEGGEYGFLEDFSTGSSVYTSSAATKDRISVIECWYKDKDGDVCLLVWANDVIIKDMPKFFYPRIDGKIKEYEEIDILDTGAVQGEMPGAPEDAPLGGQIAKVKVVVPTRFPFVIQYNVPKEKSYYGKSDPDIISDQQEGVKKLLSIEEEKQILGTTKIFVRRGSGIAGRLNNAVSQIIETDDPNGDIRVVDLKTAERGLKELYGIYVQAAKDTLGVTEASQGRADSGSLSGRALDILANNTAGRISVKIFEKHIAFTELYQLYYDFVIAFIDDARPYRNKDKIFGYFDKSLLIKQDDSGEWYYPEFDIKISADTGFPKDKRFIMDSANASGGRIDPIEYWMIMESINFPNAGAILERERKKEEMAMAQQAPPPGGPTAPPGQEVAPAPQGGQSSPGELAGILQALPPEIQQMIMQLPPEEQIKFLSQPMDQIVAVMVQVRESQICQLLVRVRA